MDATKYCSYPSNMPNIQTHLAGYCSTNHSIGFKMLIFSSTAEMLRSVTFLAQAYAALKT
jgi:hypothetical protein